MKFRFIFLTVILIWGSAHAESLVGLTIGKTEHKVNRSDYQKIEKSLKKTADALATCSLSHVVYNDPIINRQNSYVIRDGGAFCNVVVIKDSAWQYNCKFLMSDVRELAKQLYARVESRELLGDFTDYEQSLFFNQKKCAVEEL